VREYRAMMVSADPEGYAGCCEALSAWEPGAALGTITAPTLVLAGSEDPATPPAQAEAIRDAIPGARLHVLPGAGHLANLEQPEAFNRLLLDHLTARPAAEAA
jgi:3-oxoadipate enol-lactonase